MSNSDWYKSWFDTKWYHILYKHRDVNEAQGFIDKLDDYLLLHDEQIILDLACGKGRHAVYLNLKGRNVVGVDLSEQSIQFAQQYENKRLKFLVHDMRKTLYPNYFDVVLNLFTSFGYFETDEENTQVIQAVYDMLAPNGYCVLDFLNVKKVITGLVAKEEKEIDNIRFYIEREVINGFITKQISFQDKGNTYDFVEKVRALVKSDFIEYFRRTNFELINVFGDYQLNPFDEEASDRLILIAKKK